MRSTVWVWLEPSVTESVAVYPAESGAVKATATVQPAPTGRVAGQLLVCLNVPFAGDTEMEGMLTRAALTFRTVTSNVLLEPGTIVGKVRLFGVTAKA